MIKGTMSHSADLSSKREQFICLISGSLVFLISLVISRIYTGGDQVGYHNVYAVVSGLGLDDRWRDIHSIYQSRISALAEQIRTHSVSFFLSITCSAKS